MGNAFMKSVLIWVSSRFGEASHRIRHILTHLFMDHCQTSNIKKHYEEKREKKPRTQHIRLYIHSNWNLHITFPHVLHHSVRSENFMASFQICNQRQYLYDTHVTCSFFCSRCVCVCRFSETVTVIERKIFAGSAEVSYRPLNAITIAITIVKMPLPSVLWIMTIFHSQTTKWFAPTNQYVGYIDKMKRI